jgi:hypothetical protein
MLRETYDDTGKSCSEKQSAGLISVDDDGDQ